MPQKTTIVPSVSVLSDENGIVHFNVSMVITFVATGDLPSKNVFVYQIADVDNPKLDVFLRVGSIQDVTTLPTGRDVAILQSKTTYLSSNAAVSFTDAESADQAKALILTRLNTLIGDWTTYNTSLSDTTPITLPTVSPDVVNAYKAQYAAQKTASTTAQLALVSANATLTAAKKTASDAGTDLTNALADSAYCNTTQSLLQKGIQDETVFVSAMTNFISSTLAYIAANSTDPNISVLRANTATAQAALNLEPTAMAELNQALARVTTECMDDASAVDAAMLAKSTADSALGTATSAQAQAAQTLAAAQALQNATLQKLLVVCPDFTA